MPIEGSTQLQHSWPTGQKLYMRREDRDAAAAQFQLTEISPEARTAYIQERNTNRAWVQVHMEVSVFIACCLFRRDCA